STRSATRPRGVATAANPQRGHTMTASSQGPSPVDRTRPARRPRRAADVKARRRRAALESLEPRTLLAVLPGPTAPQSPVNVSRTIGGAAGSESSPSIVVNPSNPLQLASVWTRIGGNTNAPYNTDTTVFVEGAFSADGGQTWTAFAVPAG